VIERERERLIGSEGSRTYLSHCGWRLEGVGTDTQEEGGCAGEGGRNSIHDEGR
jgi:hypothetical protein